MTARLTVCNSQTGSQRSLPWRHRGGYSWGKQADASRGVAFAPGAKALCNRFAPS